MRFIPFMIQFYSDNSMQKIRKSSYFRTPALKDFQAPFLCYRCPEENPLPRNTSLAWHISLTKSAVPIYTIKMGKITGLYIAVKEVLWRPHNKKICLESDEIMKKKNNRHYSS